MSLITRYLNYNKQIPEGSYTFLYGFGKSFDMVETTEEMKKVNPQLYKLYDLDMKKRNGKINGIST